METEERKSLIRKGRIDRLKTAITNILSHDSGFDFLIKLRLLGMSDKVPVTFNDSNKNYYDLGRQSVVAEVMEMIKRHDFQGYIRLLQYEQNLKQRKDDGN